MRGLLDLVSSAGELLYPFSYDASYKSLIQASRGTVFESFVPSVTNRVLGSLERRGLVRKVSTLKGVVVQVTEEGRREVLKYNLEEFVPKRQDWDGLWRIVFFDVAELDRKRRDHLRRYLKLLGLKQFQKSVWITPFDISREVKYVREVLDIPHGVKLGILKEVENSEDLRYLFGI